MFAIAAFFLLPQFDGGWSPENSALAPEKECQAADSACSGRAS